MEIKTILTPLFEPLGENRGNMRAMEHAEALASEAEAHLEILGIGCDRTQLSYYYAGASATVQQETFEEAKREAEEIAASVKDRFRGSPLTWSSEVAVSQLVGLSQLVAGRARFCDLVVMPQPYGKERGSEYEVALEAAMFDGHAPVLVVPDEGPTPVRPQRVVVAWNQSPEALAAIRRAMPFLRDADLVNIAIIDPPRHGPDRSDPGGALSQMLSRHGLRCEISVLSKTMPKVSDVLSRHVSDTGADMLVMGAYGHSRFREAILGGATRDLLEEPPAPVLMAR